nr:MAG TPA: hypothetical protein [Caudoviricetes sp.]
MCAGCFCFDSVQNLLAPQVVGAQLVQQFIQRSWFARAWR